MTRLALVAASLLVGLAAVSPVQAIDLSRLADFDPEDMEISELAPEIHKMVRNPATARRAMKDLEEALEDDEDLAPLHGLVKEAVGQPKRAKRRPAQSMVASAKAVKGNVKEVKATEPAVVGNQSASGRSSSRSVNCTKFVPYASTTIPVDCE